MKKILIFEDDPLIARLYQTVIQYEGYEVLSASDGVEGMDILMGMKDKPVIILLDIMMPRKSGLQVLTELKANPDTKEIPVIVLTNLSSSADAQNALLMGAIKYIVKSKNKPKQVLEEIKEVLEGYTRDSVPTVNR